MPWTAGASQSSWAFEKIGSGAAAGIPAAAPRILIFGKGESFDENSDAAQCRGGLRKAQGDRPHRGATAQGILEKAREFRAHALDVVEWRVDFYEDVFQLPKVLSTLKGLREILGETPILFTFRTRKEGGEKEIDMEAYTALNTAVAQSGDADAVDVEVFSGDEVVRRNIQAIHAAGKAVVGSNHDFGGTPDKADLLFRLRKMQELGADIPKIAVMPRCPGDVIALLDATQEMSGKYADRPIITMSMGAGWSAACAGSTSARP